MKGCRQRGCTGVYCGTAYTEPRMRSRRICDCIIRLTAEEGMCLDSRCPISFQLEIHACFMLTVPLMKYGCDSNFTEINLVFSFHTLVRQWQAYTSICFCPLIRNNFVWRLCFKFGLRSEVLRCRRCLHVCDTLVSNLELKTTSTWGLIWQACPPTCNLKKEIQLTSKQWYLKYVDDL